MKKCLELAKAGEGKTCPNPLVGAIVLDENNNLISKGYHKQCGDPHAEVNALNKAGEKAKNGTIIVNLEPCSHYGRTPPCADLIINSGIKKVIIGMVDPNPLVAGSGIKKLKDAQIEVIDRVLEQECKKINEKFITYIVNKKPFISIKTATTIDGKIATNIKSSKWITSWKAREQVQCLRHKYRAILTGSGTVITDNPSLNCRNKNHINPIRIIIDSKLKTPPDSKVYNNDDTRVIIAIGENIKQNKVKKFGANVEIIKCPLNEQDKIDLKYLTNKLYELEISSILVEAGGKLNASFVKNNLVEKFYFFIAPKILGDNKAYSMFEGLSPLNIDECINFKISEVISLAPDILIEAYL